jgi:hypothetical protein
MKGSSFSYDKNTNYAGSAVPASASGEGSSCGGAPAQQAAQLPQDYLPSSQQAPSVEEGSNIRPIVDARPILPLAAFFMGDLRDGLPMVSLYFGIHAGFKERVSKACREPNKQQMRSFSILLYD